MIDNTQENYKPENGDYFKTNSVSAETLLKFAKHFDFYDVEGLITHCTTNPVKDSKLIGTYTGGHSSREINISEILYHINKPNKSACNDTYNIDEDYVLDVMNFHPKQGDWFDLCKHTPEQRQWLQDNLKTYCNSDFMGCWSEEGKKGCWNSVVWDGGEFVGTDRELDASNEIHINDILA